MKDNRPANPHLAHGEPAAEVLSDGSVVYNCCCGYAFENEREATTGHAYEIWQRGAHVPFISKPWDAIPRRGARA